MLILSLHFKSPPIAPRWGIFVSKKQTDFFRLGKLSQKRKYLDYFHIVKKIVTFLVKIIYIISMINTKKGEEIMKNLFGTFELADIIKEHGSVDAYCDHLETELNDEYVLTAVDLDTVHQLDDHTYIEIETTYDDPWGEPECCEPDNIFLITRLIELKELDEDKKYMLACEGDDVLVRSGHEILSWIKATANDDDLINTGADITIYEIYEGE